MKKAVMLIVILALAGVTAYMLLSKKETTPPEKRDGPLAIGNNSDSFTTAFSRMMDDYYLLQSDFVNWDTAAADKSALALQKAVTGLRVTDVKADSSIIETAQNLAGSIDGDIKGLLGEKTIEEKRREFNMVTDELYNLVRVVRYNGAVIYHIKCPMAFQDSLEGYWLSNSSKIVNPYLGNKHPTYKNKMLGCGEVVDSLDFSKK